MSTIRRVAKPVKLTAAEKRTLKRLLAKRASGVSVETPRLKGGEAKTKNTGRAFWTGSPLRRASLRD